MSQWASQQIILPNTFLSTIKTPHVSDTSVNGGYTDSLSKLLPSLVGVQLEDIFHQEQRCFKELTQLDWYMREEAYKFLHKALEAIMKCELSKSVDMTLWLPNCISNPNIQSCYRHKKLGIETELLNHEQNVRLKSFFQEAFTSSKGDWSWLSSNIRMLAHSVELVLFSESYEADSEKAMVDYAHILDEGESLRFAIHYFNRQLSLEIHSPLHSFMIVSSIEADK